MKEWFYGSALELIEFFEENMKWYLNEKDMTDASIKLETTFTRV
jgi:hypothetical protein